MVNFGSLTAFAVHLTGPVKITPAVARQTHAFSGHTGNVILI